MIAFIGSVFSPYYAMSGRRDPLNHCAFNIALYGGTRRWAMTERGRSAVRRTAEHLSIGRSSLALMQGALMAELDERCAPLPFAIKGEIRLLPEVTHGQAFMLAPGHQWQPIAPAAIIDVRLTQPALAWRGRAYFDSNWGDRPLEDSFTSWTWSRRHIGTTSRIHYDVERRDGSALSLGLDLAQDGTMNEAPREPWQPMPRSAWRLQRQVRLHTAPCGIHAWEDTPFYSRTLIDTVAGHVVQEHLSLPRLTNPLVRMMLPFRMPRALR